MCRLAALVGAEALPLSALLSDPPHSLEHQSYAPTSLLNGHVNVDGTGVAWVDDAGQLLRYVCAGPLWSDPNLPLLAPHLRARVQVAAVRSATPGIPFGAAFAAPFALHGLAFAHNGFIASYRERVMRPLLAALPEELFALATGASDSLGVFLTVLAAGGGTLAERVARGLGRVVALCADAGVPARLNLAAVEAGGAVLTRWSTAGPCNTLWVAQGAARWPGALLAASEPLDDDPAWREVPPCSLVTLAGGRIDVHPLDLERT